MVIPESVRSGAGSRLGFQFGSSPVSSAGNIPKQCQSVPTCPCSLHRPRLPALLVCPQKDAVCSPGLIMGLPGLKTLGQLLISYNLSPWCTYPDSDSLTH